MINGELWEEATERSVFFASQKKYDLDFKLILIRARDVQTSLKCH